MVNYSAGSASIAIRPDLREFRKRIKAELSAIDDDLLIDVAPDLSGFKQKLDGFLRTVDDEVDVSVNLDAASAQAKIQQLIRGRDIDIDVDVDTAAAQLQVAALNSQLSQTEGSLARIGVMSTLVGTIGAAASGAVAPVSALATGLVSISGSLVTIPAMAGAAGAGLAGVLVGSMGVMDAFSSLSGDAEEFEEALADLSPTASGFMRSIRGVKDEWSGMQEAVQDNLFQGLGYSIETFTESQLPSLTSGLSATNRELNRGLRASIAQFSTESAALDFSAFLDNSARGISGLALSAAPLSQIWMDVATVGSEYLPDMSRSLGLATQRWSMYISEARRTGEINDLINNGMVTLDSLIEGVSDAGGILGGTVQAANAAGQPMIGTLGTVLDLTNQWVNSAEGSASLTQFFGTTAIAVSDLSTLLGPVATTLVRDLIPGFAGFVSGAAPGALQLVNGLSDGLSNAAPNLALVGEGVGDLAGSLAPLSPVLSTAVDLLGDAGSELSSVSAPLGVVAEFLGDHPNLVVAAAAAWGTWKMLPNVVEKLSGTLSFAPEAVKNVGLVGSSIVDAYGAARAGAPEIGRFGAGLQVLGGEGGVASAALDGVRRAGTGVLDLFGGPWGVGLIAAGAAVTAVADASHRASEAEDALAGQSAVVAEAQAGLVDAVAGTTGALGEEGLAAAAELARAELIALEAVGQQMDGWLSDTGVHAWNFEGSGMEMLEEQQRVRDTGEAYERLEEIAGQMGLSIDEVHQVVAAGGPQYDQLVNSLRETDDAGQIAANELEVVRQKIEEAVDAARRLDPGMREAAEAVAILADESSSANDKLGALNSLLQQMGLAPKDAERAMRDASESIAELAAKATTLADDSGILGDALFGLDGQIDFSTANGIALFDAFDELSMTLQNVAANGADTTAKFEEMQPTLKELQEEFGLSDAKMQELINRFGLVPDTLDILVGLEGADTADEELAAILTGLANVGEGATVEVETLSDEAMARLKELDIEVHKDRNGNVVITDNAWTTRENIIQTLDGLETKGKHTQTWEEHRITYWESRGYSASEAAQIQGPVAPAGLATGGRLPKTGPGTEVVDGFLAVDDHGMPIARVNRGEWVVNEKSSDRYDRELAAINAGTFPKLEGYVDGGRVAVRSAAEIDDFAQGIEGKPYVWGGVNWGDCSGAMSAIARFATGLEPFAGRFATGNQREALLNMGFTLGMGAPGDLRFGWFNGGPWGGHTSGTLPNGTSVEMGGARGNGQYGGQAAPANHSQYTDHAFLTVPDADFSMYGLDYGASSRSRRSSTGVQVAAPLTAKSDSPASWSDIAGIAASGLVSDALSVFGISDSPPALQAWAAWQDATSPEAAGRSIQWVDTKDVASLERDIANTEEELRIEQLKLTEMKADANASTRAAAELRLKKKQESLDDLRVELNEARIGHLYEIRDDGTLGSKIDTQQVGPTSYQLQQDALAEARTGMWEAVVGKRPVSGILPEAVAEPLRNFALDWGLPLKLAMGGSVPWIGGPLADAVPALLSGGEHVMRSITAAQSRPLLDAMNADPNFANILTQSVMQPQSSANTTIEYHIHAANADEGIRRAEMMERRRLAAQL